jgi:hypothetical protein
MYNMGVGGLETFVIPRRRLVQTIFCTSLELALLITCSVLTALGGSQNQLSGYCAVAQLAGAAVEVGQNFVM